MIRNRLFQDKTFKNHKDLFHALKDNETFFIDAKKSSVYKSKEKGQGVLNFKLKNNTTKSNFKSGFIYPVINSTGWLDSHDDVHIRGCYTKTVKEQQGRAYYIDSHLKGLTNIITKKKDINMFIDDISWGALGKSIEGVTESLLFEISEEKVKPDYLDLIKSDPELENSFAMQYVKITMAMDSNDSAFKENKDAYDHFIQNIANKDLATKNKMFFAVEELKIMGEGSLCPVIGGSNSATGVITVNEPSKDTQENENKEAVNNTSNLINFYNNLKF